MAATRVVTRLQFNFYNGDQLAADPFFVDTHSVHGPVPATLPGKILVSRVDVIILHTERPPASPAAGTTAGAVPMTVLLHRRVCSIPLWKRGPVRARVAGTGCGR